MIKVLSLRQPWATLLVMGEKLFETRSWPTKYRGTTLIQAAGRIPGDKEIDAFLADHFFSAMFPTPESIKELPYGAIIGRVDIADCLKSEEFNLHSYVELLDKYYNRSSCNFGEPPREAAFGDYGPGRYFFPCVNAVQFDKPVPAKGSLGMYNLFSKRHFEILDTKHLGWSINYLGELVSAHPSKSDAEDRLDEYLRDRRGSLQRNRFTQIEQQLLNLDYGV